MSWQSIPKHIITILLAYLQATQDGLPCQTIGQFIISRNEPNGIKPVQAKYSLELEKIEIARRINFCFLIFQTASVKNSVIYKKTADVKDQHSTNAMSRAINLYQNVGVD